MALGLDDLCKKMAGPARLALANFLLDRQVARLLCLWPRWSPQPPLAGNIRPVSLRRREHMVAKVGFDTHITEELLGTGPVSSSVHAPVARMHFRHLATESPFGRMGTAHPAHTRTPIVKQHNLLLQTTKKGKLLASPLDS
jgi:hypothetical protein